MNVETELKLALPAGKNAAFKRLLAAHAAGAAQVKQLTSIYFDTPSCELAQRDMALRLRLVDGQWIQTLKLAEQAGAGLHRREEIKFPVSGQKLELERITDRTARRFLSQKHIASALLPLFSTDIKRTQWNILDTAGNKLEIALDQGSVACDQRAQTINEVEIELKRGDAAALFACALDWCRTLPLISDMQSKAARGYALYLNKSNEPAKAQTPQLHAKLTPQAALRIVVIEILRQLQANVPGILANNDIEFVHQARIALRRLRSAQKAFAEILPSADWRSITAEIQWLASLLGQIRDLDVLLTEILPPIAIALKQQTKLSALKKILLAQRKQHLVELRAALRSARYGELLLRLLQWLHTISETPPHESTDLIDFSNRSLQKRWRQVDRLTEQWQTLNTEQRHDLRKRAKKLRYAVEFFSSLYKHKPVERYLEKLRALLDVLGAANDCVNAQAQIKNLIERDATLAPNANFVIGWLAAQRQCSTADFKSSIKKFESEKLFW